MTGGGGGDKMAGSTNLWQIITEADVTKERRLSVQTVDCSRRWRFGLRLRLRWLLNVFSLQVPRMVIPVHTISAKPQRMTLWHLVSMSQKQNRANPQKTGPRTDLTCY